MLQFFKLIRVKEYVKNIIVFAPLFFSAEMLNKSLIIDALISFVCFCFIASSIYILNDLIDIEYDKQHPKKKNRPIASGKISKTFAIVLMLVLLISSTSISYFVNIELLIVIASYFVLNILYSLWLKHIAIIDIFIISVGFILRLLAGAFATNIILSDWIILLTLLLSVFLILGKRRQDVIIFEETKQLIRKSIQRYNKQFIDNIMVLISSVIISIYIMYSISADIVLTEYGKYFKLSSLWIILAFLRYFQLVFVMNKNKSPIYLFLSDIFLIIVFLLWVLSCLFFIYY
jgi:4-hydroxybenzoate polyprenyltransferase